MGLRERKREPWMVVGTITSALMLLQGAYNIAAGIPGIGEHPMFEPTRQIIREHVRDMIRKGGDRRFESAVEGKRCTPVGGEEYIRVIRAIGEYRGIFSIGAFRDYMQDIGLGDAYQNLILPKCDDPTPQQQDPQEPRYREPSSSRRLI